MDTYKQPDLTQPAGMTEILARMDRMQEELDNLKQHSKNLTPSALPAGPKVSTTRRKLLKRLAGGLVAGLAVGGIGVTLPQQAEAKFVAANGWGAIVMPPGGSITGSPPTGTVNGLYATSDAALNLGQFIPNTRAGVVGFNAESGASGITYYGVVGRAANYGVYGSSDSGNGVSGFSNHGYGVYGSTSSSSGIGVYGATSDTSAANHAGYFTGNVFVSGSVAKTGGTFKIDHPLDPANKYLYHSFVESPDMKNIYDGLVTLDEAGLAVLEMPDWFEALNSDFRYQLTSIGGASPNLHIAEKIKGRQFKIAGGNSGQEISWMVTGIRQDEWAKAHRFPVEEDKTGKEKGKYIHPELFGQPKEMSVHPDPAATSGVFR